MMGNSMMSVCAELNDCIIRCRKIIIIIITKYKRMWKTKTKKKKMKPFNHLIASIGRSEVFRMRVRFTLRVCFVVLAITNRWSNMRHWENIQSNRKTAAIWQWCDEKSIIKMHRPQWEHTIAINWRQAENTILCNFKFIANELNWKTEEKKKDKFCLPFETIRHSWTFIIFSKQFFFSISVSSCRNSLLRWIAFETEHSSCHSVAHKRRLNKIRKQQQRRATTNRQ